MIEWVENNTLLFFLIIFFVIFFVWLGWKIRIWWKNFLFMLLRKRGQKGEKASVKLLEKNGYKVIDEQIKLNGYFFINGSLKQFDLRPDLLVEKDGIKYIAEIKTGEVANPTNRNTRRQLHEYSYYSGHEVVLLVDPIKKSIKKLSFQRVTK
tara:strand:+ start:219 stop:674 length:456 start_codon:yes stop_codon:yes gene_type:complete